MICRFPEWNGVRVSIVYYDIKGTYSVDYVKARLMVEEHGHEVKMEWKILFHGSKWTNEFQVKGGFQGVKTEKAFFYVSMKMLAYFRAFTDVWIALLEKKKLSDFVKRRTILHISYAGHLKCIQRDVNIFWSRDISFSFHTTFNFFIYYLSEHSHEKYCSWLLVHGKLLAKTERFAKSPSEADDLFSLGELLAIIINRLDNEIFIP